MTVSPWCLQKNERPFLAKEMGFSNLFRPGFMDSGIKCFLNKVKRVLFPDSCLFCTPPFMKNSVIFNQQHRQTSTEMAVLFSMHGNVFLKSEVTRSAGQRNPRWHSYLISFLARSYSADGLEGWPLWHFCITACYSNCLCKCFFIRLLLVSQRLMPGRRPWHASLGPSSVWLSIAVS